MKKVPPLLPDSLPVSPSLARKIGVCGAMIVNQIHFWCEAKVNMQGGYRWTYQTYQQWAEMLPFGASTIRHALSELEKIGLVITGHYNKTALDQTKWYRLNYAHELLNSDSLQSSVSDTPPVLIGHMAVSESDTSLGLKSLPEKSTEIAVANATEEITMKIEKNTSGVKVPVKKPSSSDEVLAKLQQKNHNLAPPKDIKAALVAVWRTVPKFNKDVKIVPVLTTKDQSNLSYIGKHLGPTADVTLSHVISHWIAYAKFVESAKGIKKTPNTPDIGFVVKYLTEAASFYKASVKSIAPKQTQKPATLAPSAKVQPVLPKTDDEDEKEASLDDVLAWKSKLK